MSLTRPRPRAQSCSKPHVIAVRRHREAGKPLQAWAAQATWRPCPPTGAPAMFVTIAMQDAVLQAGAPPDSHAQARRWMEQPQPPPPASSAPAALPLVLTTVLSMTTMLCIHLLTPAPPLFLPTCRFHALHVQGSKCSPEQQRSNQEKLMAGGRTRQGTHSKPVDRGRAGLSPSQKGSAGGRGTCRVTKINGR